MSFSSNSALQEIVELAFLWLQISTWHPHHTVTFASLSIFDGKDLPFLFFLPHRIPAIENNQNSLTVVIKFIYKDMTELKQFSTPTTHYIILHPLI